jgi:Tol biopolymer transport system component
MKNSKILIHTLLFLGIFLTCENPEEPDTTPPVVSIQSPLSGEVVNEIVTIVVSTNDNEEIEKVDFIVDDSLHLMDFQAPYEYSWNTSTLTDSSYHTVKVISYDISNNSTESQPILVTVNNSNSYPMSITITSIIFESGNLKITWNKSLDADFDSYELEKSPQSTMEEYALIYTTNEIADTIYADTDINPLLFQYYRIVVKDTVGFEVKGQIESSSLDPVPSPVNVISVSYSLEEMMVIWEESLDSDFNNYCLLYSQNESGLKDTIEIFTNQSITSYTLTDFDPSHENWFWIIVTDTLNQSTIGNGFTNMIDVNPIQIDVASVTYNLSQMVVQWDQSQENDFISYELLYSETEYGSQSTIATITDKIVTSYVLIDFVPTHENWFWIKVTDYWGLTTIGNGLSNSIDNAPTQIDVTSVNYDHNNMIVNWDESPDNDFISYEILYSDTQFGNQVSLATIDNKSTISISFPITVYDPTIENWFWIKVTDYWGLSTVGDEMSNQIEVPPTQSELNPIFYFDNSFHVSWPNNIDDDFLSYDLYESIFEDMTNENLIFSSTEKDSINYIVKSVNDDELRYYRLIINDTWGFSTLSSIRIASSHQKIVYVANDSENSDIYVMNPDGKDQVNITNNSGYYDSPLWSPDGLKIFYLFRQDNTLELFVMNLDGGNQINITDISVPFRGVSNPDLSPDGTRITFTSSFDDINSEVYVIDSNGGNLTRLTYNSDVESRPKWSPDGNKIVYYQGDGDIYIINSDGSGLTNLTNSPEYENLPAFSADGSKIVFILWSDSNSNVYTMNIDGSNKINVTSNFSSKSYPIWSPDDQFILFSERIDDIYKDDIVRINPDGTGIIYLTASIENDYQPVFSEFSSKIYFTSNRDGNGEIYFMNFDGNDQTNLTNTNRHEYDPQFQPRP